MSNFTYVLSYDPNSTNYSAAQLHAFITSHRMIKSWYLAYSGTYIFKSDEALITLVENFRGFFHPSHFFLALLLPNYTGGSLPQTVWDWVNTGQLPVVSGNQ